jgi:FkbM family methyltransferase
MQISDPLQRPLAKALSVLTTSCRLRGVDRILNYLFDPKNQRPLEYEMPFFEFTYRGDVSRLLDWYVYFHGIYEIDDVLLMRAILSSTENAVALDVGANTGHHTLAMAGLCDAVHAFEPYPPVRAVLERRLRQNSITNVSVHPFGLGTKNAEVTFEPPGWNLGAGRFVESPSKFRLPMRRGDELGLRKIDFIKIDTEGHELDVLDGLRRLLERCRPFLMIEVNHAIDNWNRYFPSDYVLYQNKRTSVLRTREAPRRIAMPSGGNFLAAPAEKAAGLAGLLPQ